MTEKFKFAVVEWHDGNGNKDLEHGGWVVRTAYAQPDGSWWIPRPYSNVVPTMLYQSEKVADRKADKLNGRI